MRTGVAISIGVAIAFATGCPTLDPYVCTLDADCNAALGGACEDDQRCSYPDATCDSERRYAGSRDFDGSCVPLPDDDTTGSTVESGSILYTDSWDYAGGKDYANALTMLDDGRFAIAGFVTREDGDQDVLVQLRDATGAIVWNEIFGGPGLDIGEKIFVDGTGNLLTCGSLFVDGVEQGFIRSYTLDQELVLDVVLDEPEGSAIRGCESRGDGTFAVVGTLGNIEVGPGIVALYDEDDGSELWRTTVDGTGVQLRDVTTHPDGSIVAAGMHFDPRLAIVAAVPPEGGSVWQAPLGLVYEGLVDECFGVARDDTGVYAMGRILESGQDAWVGLYANFEGDPSWWPAAQNGHSDEFHELVIHADGDRVFAGSRTGHDIWVARYDPDYELRWEDALGGVPNENDKAWDIAFAPDGTLVAVGYISTLAEGPNVWVRRYAP